MTKIRMKPLEVAVERRGEDAHGSLRFAFCVSVTDDLQWDCRAEGMRFRLVDAMGCPMPPGKPEIPAVTMECAVPSNTKDARILNPRIAYAENLFRGVVAPVARKTIRESAEPGSDRFWKDPSVYDAGHPFPSADDLVQLIEEPLLHTRFPCPGVSLLSLRVFLAQFDPGEGVVRFPSRFDFELQCETGGAPPEWFGGSIRRRADEKGFWTRALDLSFGGKDLA